ncbi:MAG TPA: class I SAM-dependent methyltransferase, partial [Mycobacterium sp.]
MTRASEPSPGTDAERFEQVYRDDRKLQGLPAATPWDIGG